MILGSSGHEYCRGRMKRGMDLVGSTIGLILLAPLLSVLALIALFVSGRPILFIQERVGLDGVTFRILKFRTMRIGSENGLAITGRDDQRVTPWGRILRLMKLDELPQLVNVLRGDMSIVGPRPEVPRYVATYDSAQRRVLETRPGLTDPATIEFREEEALLGKSDLSDRERTYVDKILPRKLQLNLQYLNRANVTYDLTLILQTLVVLFLPRRS